MKRVLIILALLMPVNALAQEASLEVMCRSLPDYKVPDGVEHVPGAEAVVPADLNPLHAAAFPDVITIPIDVMLAKRFQAVKIPNDLELQPTVATLSIHRDGRVEYNGQDVSGQAYSLCGKSVGIAEEASDNRGNGQTVDDELQSGSEVIEVKDGIEGEVLEGQYQ